MPTSTEPPITVSGKVLQKGTQTGLKGATIMAESVSLGREISQTTREDGTYILSLEPGLWKLKLTCPGFVSPEPVENVFNAATPSLDFALSPGIDISGTVFWFGTDEYVSAAAIQAALKDDQGKTLDTHSVYTDGYGNFKFTNLEPGKWSFVVLHENGLPSDPL